MSGIYIPGMEMPGACCACPCSYDNLCAVTKQYPTFDECLDWLKTEVTD